MSMIKRNLLPVLSHSQKEYERFARENAQKYKTDEAMENAFIRYLKGTRNVLITEEEFIEEAGPDYAETSKDVFTLLSNFSQIGILRKGAVYNYARYKWCLNNMDAITFYEICTCQWIVNECDSEIPQNEAIKRINEEFGFEEGRIRILETPYYSATDFNSIRFNCGNWKWLVKNGKIFRVYV